MTLQEQEDQDQEKIEVAERVYKVLLEDGVIGPQALGESLWSEFEAAFKDKAK